MLIGQGEDVLGDGALVCLVETGQAEGAGLEASRGRIRDGERLVGMEGAAVVLGLTVLVSLVGQSSCEVVKHSMCRTCWAGAASFLFSLLCCALWGRSP